MTTSEPKYRTITLTDHAPVRVREDHWPIIASARSHDGQVECQANRRWYLTVRQHEDGRTIVYGHYSSAFSNERDLYAGELLDATTDGDAIVSAIRSVGGRCGCDELIDECIADLPAIDLG
jgi:hypothetical protein